ncbi:hypothetical protein Q8A67_002822 [Cirrhinus molitorella]|uniref:FIIND domain-containing protein n=1 Tax=Cirrhinus molitorella TaxID=172907 RepID=A0AA88TX78_9TELE|nr:hypothetical protein Q8A67_002822 [Cirrhinus molitorella]
MFKKNTTENSSENRPPVSYLVALNDKLQMNAEKVERNISETIQNLNKDIRKINEGRLPLYQRDINKAILDSLELLNTLDEDAAEAFRLQHPQSEMIEKDMKHLRENVMKLREEHDRIYNCSTSISWGKTTDKKLGDSEWEVERPSEITTDSNTKYSISSSAGQHECSETGLRWQSSSDVSLEYRFADWESLSKDIMKNYTPCGPLIDISVTSGTLGEIQLPHFISVDSASSPVDAVKALYMKDGTVTLERCELSGLHAKLLNPTTAFVGVVANQSELPLKFHCETLIYRNRKSSLNLHVYLIVKDQKLKKDVEEKEKKNMEILKPIPDEVLTMDDSYTLKTSCGSKIKPSSLKMTPGKTNFFDLHLQDAKECVELSIETKEGHKIWEVNIESDEFNINSSGADWRLKTINRSVMVLQWWRHLIAAIEQSAATPLKTPLPRIKSAVFVEKHRAELIRKVSLVEPIADDMKDQIGDEKYQTILKCSDSTNQLRPTNSDLTTLIDKLQSNADKVEKNVLEAEQNLNRDIRKINEGRLPLYQEVTNKAILDSLELLNTLDEDAAEASRLQHPQSEMIEKDMKQLRVRVMKLREEHDRIYNFPQSKQVSTWVDTMIDEKLSYLNNKGFGQDLLTIESELEEHSIFHSEVEALTLHITGERDDFDDQQAKYNKLLESSTARQKNLLSLRDYMRRCCDVLYWMEQQAEERFAYDWSDNNLDYPARKRQYENYISECLVSKEKTIVQLNEDGEELIEQNHLGKNVIGAHMDVVHADWREYLNLLICEENHLKNMDDYHKFHRDARDINNLLKGLETEINQKYNSEFKDMYQMEGLIADLDNQAKATGHWKYRRETPEELLPIEALCEYETNEGSILRGEQYTLLKNNGLNWDVKDATGRIMNAPGLCFVILPSDPEAVAIVNNLINLHKGIKQKVASSRSALQTRLAELKNDKQEEQCDQLIAGLDKVDDSEWELTRPSEVKTDANISYSVSSSGGQHECSETGLRWQSSSDVKLDYGLADWESSLSEDILKNYTPCGPLIVINVNSGTLEEIQLPHFVCVDSASSSDDAVQVIYVKDGTVSLEKCELNGSHAKLLNPTTGSVGVVANPSQVPLKFHCETLIYRNRIASLNFHVYLIVKDQKLKKDVEENEKNNMKIVKPTPDEALTMGDSYTLNTSCGSEIKPPSLTLQSCKANFFDLYIQDAKERLELCIVTTEDKKIWDVTLESDEFNINSSVCKW